MKKFITVLCMVFLTFFSFGQNVVQAEYFIDTDNGFGKNKLLSLPASPDSTFNFTADLTGLSTGFHKLYIRTKGNNGKWSVPARRNIEVLHTPAKDNVISGEYFIDTDPGIGSATPLTVSSQDSIILQNFIATTAGLQPGFHRLYERLKDSYGNWSITFRHNLEVLKVPDSNFVAAVEYFIQADPGYGYGLHLGFSSMADTLTHSYNIALPCLNADSTYNIYLRVQDARGNWSLTALPKSFKLRDGATVTNVKSGLWSDATTWSNNMIPDANTAIVLNHDLTVDINATCKSLITLCHNVHVNTSQTLIVTGH